MEENLPAINERVEIISILKQLSNALYFLQKKSIAHRDVKPENILLFKNTDKNNNINNTIYKICDFGEAKDYAYIRSKKQKTLRGTELYMSPLLYDGLIHEDSYVEHDAYKSDVFSLGCCIIIAMNLNFDFVIFLFLFLNFQLIFHLINFFGYL